MKKIWLAKYNRYGDYYYNTDKFFLICKENNVDWRKLKHIMELFSELVKIKYDIILIENEHLIYKMMLEKAKKNYIESDKIRNKLITDGFELKFYKEGVVYSYNEKYEITLYI